MINPIKDNRLVCDRTFAKRLLSLAKSIDVCDPSTEDERDSFIYYANTLLKYQCITATDEDELAYLERVVGKDYLRDLKLEKVINNEK